MGTQKGGEELDAACRSKRPATAYTTLSHPRIGGFMVEARQNYSLPLAALATQRPLLSTNKGRQIQMREATHDREASTSSWVPAPHHELGLGSKQEVSMYDLVKLKDAKRRQQEEADNLNKLVKGLEGGLSKLKAELVEKGSEDALILGKCEFLNPGGSVKDRVAVQIIKEALESGKPAPGGVVTEGSAQLLP